MFPTVYGRAWFYPPDMDAATYVQLSEIVAHARQILDAQVRYLMEVTHGIVFIIWNTRRKRIKTFFNKYKI